MCLYFLAVLLRPRNMSLPYFVVGIKLSLYFWPSGVSPDHLALSFQLFFSLLGPSGTFGKDWVQIWFLVWSVHIAETFLSPLPQFRGFKHTSTSLPIRVSTSNSLDLKHVIRSHISVEVKHMLKSLVFWTDTFLNWSLHIFVWSILALPHNFTANYSAIHIWLSKCMALGLFHKKPNWYITYLTSWTKELTLQDHFTSRGQSFWMETSYHVVCSWKSKQLIHYHSIGFRNKTQAAERACLDFQTHCLSPHWSTFI